MTILQAVLGFMGSSITSGITWDIIKTSGEKIINKFVNNFIKSGSFKNEDESKSFLKMIADNNAISKKKPFNDVKSIYEEITEKDSTEFIELFEKWIKDNFNEFEKLQQDGYKQSVSVKIEYQENNGSGKIINAGIINNY